MATKVFVGSLPEGVEDAMFRQLFEGFGTVASSVCNPEKRYGFVSFGSVEDANQAVSAMNGFEFGGASIVVKLADNQVIPSGGDAQQAGAGETAPHQPVVVVPAGTDASTPSERIYVKGLPAGFTDDAVRHIFGPYGTILDAKVLVNDGKHIDGTGQSVAILKMGDVESASWLVTNVNGNMPEGLTRPVEVMFAGSDKQKGQVVPGKGQGGATSRYTPYPATAPPAAGVQWLPHWGGKGGKGKGGHEADGVMLPVVSQMLSTIVPNAKLYAKGLPATADDNYLYRCFAPFGSVLSVKAVQKEGYVIGFINYATEAEAQAGIAAVNGQRLNDGSVLAVSVKQAQIASNGAGAAVPGADPNAHFGVVKAWIEHRGMGFITPKSGGDDLFVHRSMLAGGLSLQVGSVVTYEPGWDQQKNKPVANKCSMGMAGAVAAAPVVPPPDAGYAMPGSDWPQVEQLA